MSDSRRTAILHGVLLRVHGLGVLLTGPAGIGKSELALELLARGHALVADDVVELRRSAGRLIGHSPPRLRGYLAVRELGVFEVCALYGVRALRRQQRLNLVVRLIRRRPLSAEALLHGRHSRQRILGVELQTLSLSVNAGHNLAILVEAACLQQRVRKK